MLSLMGRLSPRDMSEISGRRCRFAGIAGLASEEIAPGGGEEFVAVLVVHVLS